MLTVTTVIEDGHLNFKPVYLDLGICYIAKLVAII